MVGPSNQVPSGSADVRIHQDAASATVEAYEQFGDAIFGYLRANLRCDEDAHDLAQEVFLRIARHPNLGEIQSLKAFVFKIAKNLLTDRSRRWATRLAASSVSVDVVNLQAVGSDPLEQFEANECQRCIESTIAELPPACREAYLLSREHGHSYTVIADQMRISVSMVEKHISTALHSLRSACQIR